MRPSKTCDECKSTYYADSSRMAALCPECTHHLYGYPPCEHAFDADRCTRCGWDGSRSRYITSLLPKSS